MAGVPITASDQEAMEAFARAEGELVPQTPLTRRVGLWSIGLTTLSAIGNLVEEFGLAPAPEIAYPSLGTAGLALGFVYIALLRRDRRTLIDGDG